MKHTGEYWMDHALLLEIIEKSGYQNILTASFYSHYPTILKFCFPEKTINASGDPEFSSAILTSLISTALLTWVKTGQKETALELLEKTHKVIHALDGYIH